MQKRYFNRARRRWCTGVRQGAPANEQSKWPSPWGPHCYLWQERHPEPFNKGWRGALRRAERQFKQHCRADLLPPVADRDDGYFAMGACYDE